MAPRFSYLKNIVKNNTRTQQKQNPASTKIKKTKTNRDFNIDMKKLRLIEKGICKTDIRDLKTFIRRRNDKIRRLPANSSEIEELIEVIENKEQEIKQLVLRIEEIEYGVHDDLLKEKFEESTKRASENIQMEKEKYQKKEDRKAEEEKSGEASYKKEGQTRRTEREMNAALMRHSRPPRADIKRKQRTTPKNKAYISGKFGECADYGTQDYKLDNGRMNYNTVLITNRPNRPPIFEVYKRTSENAKAFHYQKAQGTGGKQTILEQFPLSSDRFDYQPPTNGFVSAFDN